MLGLPKSTEVSKLLPKKAIYAQFKMNTAAKEKIDLDISRINIVNEVSPSRVSIEEGKEVKTFFVLNIHLKRKDYEEKSIITISNLIPQNMVMILQYEDEARLAIYHSKLMQTEWKPIDEFKLELNGLNLDKVWENIIIRIGDLDIKQGRTLDEQIEIEEKKYKLKKEIEKHEKLARKECQPKKKFEYVKKINELKTEMEKL